MADPTATEQRNGPPPTSGALNREDFPLPREGDAAPPHPAGQPPSWGDKLQALEIETQLKHQAVRDTQLKNQHLHNSISGLHREVDARNAAIKAEVAEIAQEKKRVLAAKLFEEHATKDGMLPGQVPLPQLERTATDGKAALMAAEEEADACQTALRQLLAYRQRLEGDVERQLAKNRETQRAVAKAKKAVEAKGAAARHLSTEIAHIERELQATRERLRAMASEASAADRYSQKVQKRLDAYDKELGALHAGRQQSKQLVLDEVEVSAERDAWIEALKADNGRLAARLLNEPMASLATLDAIDEAGAHAAAGSGGDFGDEAVEESLEAAARGGRRSPPVAVRPAPKLPVTAEQERRLFDELHGVLEAASAATAAVSQRPVPPPRPKLAAL